MDDINLLQETIEKLKDHKKKPKDVLWVGSRDLWFSWDHFKTIADVEYDNGYGGAEVIDGLLVVGKDWWLERHEYDGSEWWEFKTLPKKPRVNKLPQRVLKRNYYCYSQRSRKKCG